MTVQQFHATVLDVIDGDTVHLAVDLTGAAGRKDRDLGFHLYVTSHRIVLHYSFRLLGLNAAEHGTPGGDAATAHLRTILTPGLPVTVSSVSNDKYGGRLDAIIFLADGTNLNDQLIADGWAASWNGVGPKPVPPWPRPVTVDTSACSNDGTVPARS